MKDFRISLDWDIVLTQNPIKPSFSFKEAARKPNFTYVSMHMHGAGIGVL